MNSGLPLAIILGLALVLRAGNLGYSEFQGDEALAMLAAAEGVEGHGNALFLRAKGPAEGHRSVSQFALTPGFGSRRRHSLFNWHQPRRAAAGPVGGRVPGS